MVSQGVPMITAGDEMGKTQGGNNNAFVQDNRISWLDWELDPEREKLLAFSREVVAFRRRHPVFRRPRFLRGERVAGSELPDIAWFRPDGREMVPSDWLHPHRAALALFLAGDALDWRNSAGDALVDDTFLVLLNGSHDDIPFTLPGSEWGSRWALRIDTAQDAMSSGDSVDAAARVPVLAHSVLIYKRVTPGRGSWRLTRSTRGGF